MLGLCSSLRSPLQPKVPFTRIPCRRLQWQVPKATLGLCTSCTQEPKFLEPPNFLIEPHLQTEVSPWLSLISDYILHQPTSDSRAWRESVGWGSV